MSSAPLRVLFAASEFAPLIKTGGLADVAGALTAALGELGVDIRVLLPAYREVLAGLDGARRVARLPGIGSFPEAELLESEGPQRQRMLALRCPALFERDGGPYADREGRDWADNALRFGLLSHVAALLSTPATPYNWRCDVLHCNDWQTALAPAYHFWRRSPRAPCLMTIHNLAYQGVFPRAILQQLALPAESFDINGIEYYGNLSFLKAGALYADRITTVSPTYAREIQTQALGFGMHGLLAGRQTSLEGILNGIDVGLWDPRSDPALAATYDADTLQRKAINTRALRAHFVLDERPEIALIGMVSRLVSQKGLDLVVAAAERIARLPAQLLVFGSGEPQIERGLLAAAERCKGQVAAHLGFDEKLSHLIEAGADMFLMPSRFEPCGLNQMYSQRYGTPPIVRRTGGLADSVVDCTPQTLADGSATGFVFDDATPEALLLAVRRAQDLWQDRRLWSRIQRNGMARDFSWSASARRYLQLYRALASP
jgi:starch synthase